MQGLRESNTAVSERGERQRKGGEKHETKEQKGPQKLGLENFIKKKSKSWLGGESKTWDA